MSAFESPEGSSAPGAHSEDFDTVEEAHPPLSPKTPAESFFLPQLGTSDISAAALAAEIHKKARSVATDDFASACDNSVDLDRGDTTLPNLFGKDVLVVSRQPIPEDSLEYEDSIMSLRSSRSKTSKTSYTASSTASAPPPAEEPHVDVAQNVYEQAKGIWAWGKTKMVFKPFLGVAEAIASKVVGVAGTSFEEVDSEVKPKLAGLDTTYLNPAINAVVTLVMNAVSKSDSFFRPIIMTILGPIGLAQVEDGSSTKKSESINPEMTTPALAMN